MPASMMARSPVLACTDGRFCRKAHGPSSGPRGKMSVPFTARQMSAILSAFSSVGCPAYDAPLMAPTEAP